MKRTMMLALALSFISVSLLASTSVDTKNKISDYRWQIQSVSDLDRSPLENEMDLVFNNDSSFALKDKSNGDEWKGKYTTAKLDSSYKLDLFFEGREEYLSKVKEILDQVFENMRATKEAVQIAILRLVIL